MHEIRYPGSIGDRADESRLRTARPQASMVARPRFSCALAGALATVTALPDAVPILHATSGCAGSVTWTQSGASGLQIGGHCGALSTPSSNVQESEVVFGGAGRLAEQISNTFKVVDGKLYVVLTSCVTEMIGDDVHGVVAEFTGSEHPVIAAETGGFRGNSYYGYNAVLESLFRGFVARESRKVKGKVNLWGIVPTLDVFWRGNLEALRALLIRTGLDVNTFFTDQDGLEDIRRSGQAELNIVVSDVYGIKAARVFEDIHGTPFISTPLPIGPSATSLFLRQAGKALGIEAPRIERIIEDETRRYYRYIEPLTDAYNDFDLQRYAVVVGDCNYSFGITKFLADDLGWIPEVAVCTDLPDYDRMNIVAGRFTDLESGLRPLFAFDDASIEIIGLVNERWPQSKGQRYYNAMSPAFVVGSSLDRELAASIGASHLSVSFPVTNRAVINRGYTGYSGGLTLVEDLLGAIVSGR